MQRISLLRLNKSWRTALALAVSSWCFAQVRVTAGEHWVGTWGCGPQLVERANLPPAPLANNTLRQFVHVTLGGKRLRARFSNAYGTNSVTMNSVRVALAAGEGSAGIGEINPATDHALTFNGATSVAIPPGQVMVSDPFDLDLPRLANLAVTVYFGDISATTLSGHPGSRTTSFIQSGNAISAAGLPGALKTAHWYTITGIDVIADDADKAIVILGDSLTDGRGATTDGNDRWPDVLALRLSTNAPTAGVAVINMGIGGNGVFGGLGPPALARFDRDVLEQSGARWLIVFEGVNDIGRGVGAERLINAYKQFANKARARNIRAYGATITPFGGSGYYTASHEAARQMVNAWLRTNTIYDGVIDFDASVRDPTSLTHLLSTYNSGDGLHLNPAGYHAMGEAIDLKLFAR